MDCMAFLKSIEHKLSDYDVIYCDPPYVNSDTMYVDSWTDNNLLELDDYLYFLNKKYNTYSIMSNYDSDIVYKGTISSRFEKKRLARTKITMSNNIIITYGDIPNRGNLDCLF